MLCSSCTGPGTGTWEGAGTRGGRLLASRPLSFEMWKGITSSENI